MNILIMRAICLLLLLWPAISFSTECENYKPHAQRYELPRICQCGADLKKLKIHIPSGFKLYSVCNLYFNQSEPIVLKKSDTVYSKNLGGSFYFRGNSVITGIVRKGQEVNRGNLYFLPNEKSSKATFNVIGFEDAEADRLFGTTKFPWVGIYWCAPATVRFKHIYLYEWDSELQGTYALDYDVLSVSKFEKCGVYEPE